MVAEAVARSLERALEAIESLNAPIGVIGGVAVAAWGHVRSTRDIDLMIGVAEGAFETLLTRLATFGFRPKRNPPIVAIEGGRVMSFVYSPPGTFLDIQVDFFPAESDFQRAALDRCVDLQLPNVARRVKVATCEDLIVFKAIAGRIIDRVDCVALARINRDRLDFEYIATWVDRLGVKPVWEEIRREAGIA